MTNTPKNEEKKEYHDHWLMEIIERIENRNHDVITLSTGKTPSGQIHLGIMRELLICDGLRRV